MSFTLATRLILLDNHNSLDRWLACLCGGPRSGVDRSVALGDTFTTTNTAVIKWSIIRYGSATYSVDIDQRRIPLTPPAAGLSYTFMLPGDSGIVMPGYDMLFTLNSGGIPSMAKTVKVTITGEMCVGRRFFSPLFSLKDKT